jgi:hypothetical protein
MPEMLSSIGRFLSSGAGQGLLGVGELGTAGAGLLGNILNERMRSQQLSQLASAEKTLNNPTQLAAEVSSATQPLNASLVSAVTNAVNANQAESGLSEAPGLTAQAISSAVAPYEQQNQSTALQLVMERLGLPLQYASTILSGLPGMANLAPILALLQKNFGGGGGGFNWNWPGSTPSGASAAQFLNIFGNQNTAVAPDPSLGDWAPPSDIYS